MGIGIDNHGSLLLRRFQMMETDPFLFQDLCQLRDRRLIQCEQLFDTVSQGCAAEGVEIQFYLFSSAPKFESLMLSTLLLPVGLCTISSCVSLRGHADVFALVSVEFYARFADEWVDRP
jgi:hypothetical protein